MGENSLRALRASDVRGLLEPLVLESSLRRLAGLFRTRPSLLGIRLDPERLAEGLAEYGEALQDADPVNLLDGDSSDDAEAHSLHAWLMRRTVPRLVTPGFVEGTHRAIEQAIADRPSAAEDVKALLTGIFLVEAQKNGLLPPQDNPLWALMLSLALRDLLDRRAEQGGVEQTLVSSGARDDTPEARPLAERAARPVIPPHTEPGEHA